MTMMGFILFPLSSPFSTVIVGMRDIWRCMRYTLAVNIIMVCDGIAAVIALSYPLGKMFGMTGIWIAQVGGCALVVLIIYILACMHERKIVTSVQEFCCYPKDFGVGDEHRLSISIHSMEEVINVSSKVIEFCKIQGVSELTAFRAGLCVEELASNIVKHGFTGKSNSVVDISVVKSPEELIIKLKDNCKLFNPEEIDAIFVPEDPVKNIGIRLVRKVCKSMEYYPLLGLNVLTIKL
jgi:anti-sigma regulatory factor (Ser/Thr protein kinase)